MIGNVTSYAKVGIHTMAIILGCYSSGKIHGNYSRLLLEQLVASTTDDYYQRCVLGERPEVPIRIVSTTITLFHVFLRRCRPNPTSATHL